MSKLFTREEVEQHDKPDDLWIIIEDHVYDLSRFANLHPGGKSILVKVAGQDATELFVQHHNALLMKKYHPKLCIGKLVDCVDVVRKESSSLSPSDRFGLEIPFSEPSWYQGSASPYYNESHCRWRQQMRKFVDDEIIPNVAAWDSTKKAPLALFKKLGSFGFFATIMGQFPAEYVPEFAEEMSKFDIFHELISIDEICRCGSGGIAWSIFAGISIGLPPILNFGSQEMQKKIARKCLLGEKTICLAITEPSAGSDVANIKTTAVRDGDCFVVNGEKKWITNGVFADYFTVAVRTGGPGMKGISLLLLERNMVGLETRQMDCMGVWPSGTSFITFENVRVPISNLIGKENEGFRYIMRNFNHERWTLAVQATRLARVCLEDSILYAHERKTFNQRLIDHAVIRAKIGEMARMVEASQAWVESVTYQFSTLSHDDALRVLGGPVALLKVQTTRTFEFCAREACHIFGGASYTKGGKGGRIERLYREVRAYAMPGGSEEIMIDLGVRQALKGYRYDNALRSHM